MSPPRPVSVPPTDVASRYPRRVVSNSASVLFFGFKRVWGKTRLQNGASIRARQSREMKPPLPYTPGSDAGGVVEAVGEGVIKAKPGDRIYTARTISGAYAEYTLALEQQVHPLPERIDRKQGAGLWVPYGTAYHALHHKAKAHTSETVLVQAQVEVWASQRFKSHVPWACTLLALPGRRKVSS